ncbi:multidrug efflux SMR transporter [Bacillus aquiflavi]|uniref:Multidrug efflux SMR transporter n=1 Tax=Bacillus aquiflavi TaxID=2672567 RepID=A0A6B3W053_9BACI|nr:multidrug efflux SMR transporter [Bacillus aquiflavi]MBA4536859.1 multidrug efflux SMR transporter [Bacillus aquiflavi]NEY81226.1 multidrug efflux SMR transporter [Bacillus aquiflavi]UAC48466.1 multidrug efflux SMR transporter [Bacillus aquiflavi]
MAWFYLLVAGFGEIGFVVFMKYSAGFTVKRYTALSIISAIISFYYLSKSLIDIPIGTAYAIWSAIGAAGSVLYGMIFFMESKSWKRLLFIGMIICGGVGLKLVSS